MQDRCGGFDSHTVHFVGHSLRECPFDRPDWACDLEEWPATRICPLAERVDYLDRFWFCGRKAHRVITAGEMLYTIPCEAIFNRHEKIYRSALVGVSPPGQQRPVIIAEPWPEHRPKSYSDQVVLIAELLELGQQFPHTAGIDTIFLMDSLPVDIRHNAKIFREKLAVWAARQLGVAAS